MSSTSALSGIKAPAIQDRVASTESATLSFSTPHGGGHVPALIADNRKFTDTDSREIQLSDSQLAQIDSVDSLEREVRSLYENNVDYLQARNVSEGDVERDQGMLLIDRDKGDHVVSLSKDAQSEQKYVTISVKTAAELPDDASDRLLEAAGHKVYRSGWSIFFQDTGETVPWEVRSHLVEQAASSNLGLRPLAEGEEARGNITFDLNGNGVIDGSSSALGLSGLRQPRFFAEIKKSLDQTKLPVSERRAAERTLRRMEAESFMNRELKFSTGTLDTYHPYSKPFDKGVRKLAETASEDNRASIDNVLNYITDRKTHRGHGAIDERNLEETIRLRVVDRGHDGQALSLAKDSNDPFNPNYVVINVATENLPAALQDHAGKAVLRNGEKLIFDITGDDVPAELVAHLQEKKATSKTGLRALESNEVARENFPYDWNRNRTISVDTINTSWWGHCHIEADLAGRDISAKSDVTLYDMGSEKKVTFGDTDVNDLIFALFDADRYVAKYGYYGVSVDETHFVGQRNDTIGAPVADDKLKFTLDNGKTLSFGLEIKEVYAKDQSDQEIDLETAFSATRLVDDTGIRFETNPEHLRMEAPSARRGGDDHSVIQGDRKLKLKVAYLDVSSTGIVERRNSEVILDPKNPSDEPTLLASRRVGSNNPPQIEKTFLNQSTSEVEKVTYSPVKQDDGSYVMEADETTRTALGKIENTTIRRELLRESIVEIHQEILRAAREGIAFTTEKTPTYAVWNYATEGAKVEVLQRDGDFVKYRTTLQTQGGAITWDYILKEDEDGKPVQGHALGNPPDFLWQQSRSVSAPVYTLKDSGSSREVYNASAKERGYLYDSQGNMTDESLAFFRYAADVVYASVADPAQAKRFVIRDENDNLYFYESEEAFLAEIAAQSSPASTSEDAVAPNPTAPVSVDTVDAPVIAPDSSL
jgi:hypothetical protein